jgi:hypothetical protein
VSSLAGGRIRLEGIARNRGGRPGALLVARGSLDAGDDNPASLEQHVPFDVELADGRRTPVEPDGDTALWVPPTMRSATVGELRVRCAEATAPLAGWPDDKQVTYQWALVRDGDPVAVVGSPRGTRFVPDTGGLRDSPQLEPDPRSPLQVDALAAGPDRERVLARILTGEDRRISWLGIGFVAAAVAIVIGALQRFGGSWSPPIAGFGLGLVATGAFTWWMGAGAPRSATRLEIVAMVGCSAPCLTWLPYTWPVLAVLAGLFHAWSRHDARVLRAIQRVMARGDVVVLRDGELSSLRDRPGVLVVGQVPVTGDLPARGSALISPTGDAVVVLPPGRDLEVARWLRRRAAVLAVLWTATAVGTVLPVA